MNLQTAIDMIVTNATTLARVAESIDVLSFSLIRHECCHFLPSPSFSYSSQIITKDGYFFPLFASTISLATTRHMKVWEVQEERKRRRVRARRSFFMISFLLEKI